MSHMVAAGTATREKDAGRYQRHRSEQTLLYQIVDQLYPVFTAHLAAQGRELPGYVQREFDDYLKCGRLEHGFLRVRCESCHAAHLVAFSCKRGLCPSCGARRMAESAALLVDEVFPEQPVHQWVLSFPFQLRYLFASRPEIMGRGNFSNVKGVGAGVYEYRIDFGPGYRSYFGKDGDRLVILLAGGTKKRQDADIAAAKGHWRDYKRRKRQEVT